MLELKQTQKLLPVLTQQLQQAIKLLQLSQLELTQTIEQELNENPVLEIEEKEEVDEKPTIKQGNATDWLELRHSPSEDLVGREEREYPGDREWDYKDIELSLFSNTSKARNIDETPNYENYVTKKDNIRDYLRWQVGLSSFDPNERVVAEWIIENIDDNGYLAYPIPEIAKSSEFSVELLENVLKKIQKLDPPGIGARDLKECIFLQYEEKGGKDPVFEDVVGSYFELFIKMSIKEISKKTGYSSEKIQEVFNKIKSFDPKPGRNYNTDFVSFVVPDVYVVKGEDGFEIHLNEDNIPEIRVNRYYQTELYKQRSVDGETKGYIKSKIKQAEWFIKSIQQRQKTLYLAAKSIVKFQEEFFEHGVRFLKPLILKDIARDIGVHESTVSRITTSKYMGTQHGIFELKFFFPTGISNVEGGQLSTSIVRDFITELVGKEDKNSPLTDDEIVTALLAQHSIKIARRTVAKYRDILNIRSSRERVTSG
jgi:RNA polymerase sigma-54 factor